MALSSSYHIAACRNITLSLAGARSNNIKATIVQHHGGIMTNA